MLQPTDQAPPCKAAFTGRLRLIGGDYKRLTGFAVELVGLNLPVIVAYGTAAATALKPRPRLSRSSWRRRSTWSALALSAVWRSAPQVILLMAGVTEHRCAAWEARKALVYLMLGRECLAKNRSISRVASGPFGSV